MGIFRNFLQGMMDKGVLVIGVSCILTCKKLKLPDFASSVAYGVTTIGALGFLRYFFMDYGMTKIDPETEYQELHRKIEILSLELQKKRKIQEKLKTDLNRQRALLVTFTPDIYPSKDEIIAMEHWKKVERDLKMQLSRNTTTAESQSSNLGEVEDKITGDTFTDERTSFQSQLGQRSMEKHEEKDTNQKIDIIPDGNGFCRFTSDIYLSEDEIIAMEQWKKDERDLKMQLSRNTTTAESQSSNLGEVEDQITGDTFTDERTSFQSQLGQRSIEKHEEKDTNKKIETIPHENGKISNNERVEVTQNEEKKLTNGCSDDKGEAIFPETPSCSPQKCDKNALEKYLDENITKCFYRDVVEKSDETFLQHYTEAAPEHDFESKKLVAEEVMLDKRNENMTWSDVGDVSKDQRIVEYIDQNVLEDKNLPMVKSENKDESRSANKSEFYLKNSQDLHKANMRELQHESVPENYRESESDFYIPEYIHPVKEFPAFYKNIPFIDDAVTGSSQDEQPESSGQNICHNFDKLPLVNIDEILDPNDSLYFDLSLSDSFDQNKSIYFDIGISESRHLKLLDSLDENAPKSESDYEQKSKSETELKPEDENEPALKDENEPALKDENEPALKDENEPALKDENEPALKDENEPALKDENEPALKDEDEPILKHENVSKLEKKNTSESQQTVTTCEKNDVLEHQCESSPVHEIETSHNQKHVAFENTSRN